MNESFKTNLKPINEDAVREASDAALRAHTQIATPGEDHVKYENIRTDVIPAQPARGAFSPEDALISAETKTTYAVEQGDFGEIGRAEDQGQYRVFLHNANVERGLSERDQTTRARSLYEDPNHRNRYRHDFSDTAAEHVGKIVARRAVEDIEMQAEAIKPSVDE
jgi:hypothetical protein